MYITVLFADLCDWQLRQEEVWGDESGEMQSKYLLKDIQ